MHHLPSCTLFVLDAQIPNWFGGESAGTTKDNPFPLPDAYMATQQRNVCVPIMLIIAKMI